MGQDQNKTPYAWNLREIAFFEHLWDGSEPFSKVLSKCSRCNDGDSGLTALVAGVVTVSRFHRHTRRHHHSQQQQAPAHQPSSTLVTFSMLCIRRRCRGRFRTRFDDDNEHDNDNDFQSNKVELAHPTRTQERLQVIRMLSFILVYFARCAGLRRSAPKCSVIIFY
ncbi:MAG: hypothetical protein WC708_13360 [Lentisphaeria bacterium]